MTLQSITLDIPDIIYHRLQQAAHTFNRPFEEVVSQSIQGNLPPALSDLPGELHGEFKALLNLSDQMLWKIANTKLPEVQWKRHQELLEKKQSTVLNTEEEAELSGLRDKTDHFVMRRSYAMAMLKWRGHSLTPLLNSAN